METRTGETNCPIPNPYSAKFEAGAIPQSSTTGIVSDATYFFGLFFLSVECDLFALRVEQREYTFRSAAQGHQVQFRYSVLRSYCVIPLISRFDMSGGGSFQIGSEDWLSVGMASK